MSLSLSLHFCSSSLWIVGAKSASQLATSLPKIGITDKTNLPVSIFRQLLGYLGSSGYLYQVYIDLTSCRCRYVIHIPFTQSSFTAALGNATLSAHSKQFCVPCSKALALSVMKHPKLALKTDMILYDQDVVKI